MVDKTRALVKNGDDLRLMVVLFVPDHDRDD